MKSNNSYRQFLEKAIELSAKESKIVDPSSIVTADWVRMKCQFGCGGYGSSYCCPPNTPRPEETRKVIDCYEKALLAHFAGDTGVTKAIVELEKAAFLSGFYKALSFGAGPCSLCKICGDDGCKYPVLARPSMEACGIDVFATARSNGFPIEVITDRSCTGNYYGLLLID